MFISLQLTHGILKAQWCRVWIVCPASWSESPQRPPRVPCCQSRRGTRGARVLRRRGLSWVRPGPLHRPRPPALNSRLGIPSIKCFKEPQHCKTNWNGQSELRIIHHKNGKSDLKKKDYSDPLLETIGTNDLSFSFFLSMLL